MPDPMEVCIEAAKAGAAVLERWQGKITVREKGPRDLVTQADLESQDVIKGIVTKAFPDHLFIGEEGDSGSIRENRGYCWIVDPLDGTTNYVHGLPGYAVSIALALDSDIVLGAVYDPLADELFMAKKDSGAFLNGKQIKTSGCQTLSDAMVAVSFPANVTRESLDIKRFIDILLSSQVVRRLGSAALNLCYVGAGRMDAYWANSVNAWDVAAGLLLVSESEGTTTNLTGGPVDLDSPELVAASSTWLNHEIRQLLTT